MAGETGRGVAGSVGVAVGCDVAVGVELVEFVGVVAGVVRCRGGWYWAISTDEG